jgi:hypothetical protein
MPIPVSARSKAWVCGRSLAAIASSSPAGDMGVCCECCVLSGGGLCVGLITWPEESYWGWIFWLQYVLSMCSMCCLCISMCCLCILCVVYVSICVVYVYFVFSMYFVCCLRILCVIYVFCVLSVYFCVLSMCFYVLYMYFYVLSMYSMSCLCILFVVYVFLDAATLTEVFPCFFLSCKANARV